MSIEPVRVSVPCRLPMDQTVESLMNWLASAGARPQAQGPTEILCEYGSRAPMAFGLIGGALAGDDKWPAKAVVRVTQGAGTLSAEQDPQPKFCMNCGGELPGEGRFCPGCGSPVPEPKPSVGQDEGSATMVEIEVLEDLPNLPLLKQTTGAAFKAKYQQRLANIAQAIQQAVAGF
jgi:hypothetical protein